MSLKYLQLVLLIFGILCSAQAQSAEKTRTIGLSVGAGINDSEDYVLSVEAEWSGTKATKNINPFVNIEYGKYPYCSEYSAEPELFFNYCISPVEKSFMDIMVGLSFYRIGKSFHQSGLTSQIGISYRLGIPEFKSISLSNSWSYKYFFSDQFYFQGGPTLDFGFVRSRLNPLDDSRTPPFFNFIHQVRIGYIL